MPPSAPSAPGATTDDAVGSTDTPSSDTGPPLPRSKKQRGKPRQLQAPGPAQAATAVCSVVAIVTVKMIQRSFRRLRTRLEDAERAKQELEATCVSSQARIDELVKSLEEKTKELAEKERRLEQMSVEQRLSKSMASLVERELKSTKKLLASYQGQLDQASYVLRRTIGRTRTPTPPERSGFPGGCGGDDERRGWR